MKTVLNFLNELKKNNTKEWFNENRKRYEESREKMLFFTELMIQEVSKFDDEIKILNPKDCFFRIFRDVRFSKDKTPYKTNMGSFITRDGRKGHRAGYYIHIEPENSFVGGGVWCPMPEPLKAVRSEIYDNADGFKEVINDKSFKNYYSEIMGEQLKTAPKGFPKDFEDIELLRHKSYAFGHELTDKVVKGDDFVLKVVEAFKELHKANRYMNVAMDKWM